ncbi:hypothetical protein LVJ94_39705 [Pendulispora rubella]|uniref:Lipoprotein n=1 Tax=Pendulispora rubella TaxID=2741070 RepID=A0ABZ2KWG1_9BACT
MKRLILCAFAMATFSALTACSDSDDGGRSTGGPGSPGDTPSGATPDGGPPDSGSPSEAPADFVLSCSAELTGPNRVEYTVSGNILHFSAGGQQVDLTLVSAAGGKPVYGTWQLPSVLLGGDPKVIEKHQLRVVSTLRIEADRVTITGSCSSKYHAMSATTSSPATITDSTIDILESHHEVKQWTPRGGEKTSSAAFAPSKLQVQAQPSDTAMLRAALPFTAD